MWLAGGGARTTCSHQRHLYRSLFVSPGQVLFRICVTSSKTRKLRPSDVPLATRAAPSHLLHPSFRGFKLNKFPKVFNTLSRYDTLSLVPQISKIIRSPKINYHGPRWSAHGLGNLTIKRLHKMLHLRPLWPQSRTRHRVIPDLGPKVRYQHPRRRVLIRARKLDKRP